jgi:hypothetical protein
MSYDTTLATQAFEVCRPQLCVIWWLNICIQACGTVGRCSFRYCTSSEIQGIRHSELEHQPAEYVPHLCSPIATSVDTLSQWISRVP